MHEVGQQLASASQTEAPRQSDTSPAASPIGEPPTAPTGAAQAKASSRAAGSAPAGERASKVARLADGAEAPPPAVSPVVTIAQGDLTSWGLSAELVAQWNEWRDAAIVCENMHPAAYHAALLAAFAAMPGEPLFSASGTEWLQLPPLAVPATKERALLLAAFISVKCGGSVAGQLTRSIDGGMAVVAETEDSRRTVRCIARKAFGEMFVTDGDAARQQAGLGRKALRYTELLAGCREMQALADALGKRVDLPDKYTTGQPQFAVMHAVQMVVENGGEPLGSKAAVDLCEALRLGPQSVLQMQLNGTLICTREPTWARVARRCPADRSSDPAETII